jgi:hypothetical protein
MPSRARRLAAGNAALAARLAVARRAEVRYQEWLALRAAALTAAADLAGAADAARLAAAHPDAIAARLARWHAARKRWQGAAAARKARTRVALARLARLAGVQRRVRVARLGPPPAPPAPAAETSV